MMPASTTITALPSATFRAAAAVPLPDTEQPTVVMERSDEDFPMPIITEVVSLADCASIDAENRFDFAEIPVPLSSSDDNSCSEPQADDTDTTFSVAKDIKPFDLQCTSNSSGTTSRKRRTDHAKPPARLASCGVKSRSTRHANEDSAGASVAKGCLPNTSGSSASVPRECYSSQRTDVKTGDGLTADKSAVGTAVVKGFEPRVLKNSTDRKYERRLPGNSAASTTPQFILVPVSINRMPVPLNTPQACINQLPASAKLVPNEALVNYAMQPSGQSNPTIVFFSPVTGTMAPNIQPDQSSLQPRAPSQAPLNARGIKSSLPPQVPLITVPQSIRQPSTPGQAPLITAPSTVSQSTQQPSAPVRASLITQEIRPSAPPQVPLPTAPSTTVSLYHGAKHQVTPVPHGSAQSMGPDKPPSCQASSESHMKQPRAILGSALRATVSCQTSNLQPKKTVEKPQQAKGPVENSALSKDNNRDSKRKSQSSSVNDRSKETASQRPRAPKMYPTQVWQRAKAGASGEAAKQPQNGHALQSQSQAVQGNMQRSSVLNSPWERIIVSSDIVSTLTLDEVRKGIETFLMVNGVPEKVSRGGAIHLHWNGSDLGTFRFKHNASGSSLSAQRITTDEAIVISSDDEQAEEAPKTTTRARPVTSHDEQGEERDKDAIHATSATATASVKSACVDPEQLLEPEIVLEESDKLLRLKRFERSSSDSEDLSSDSEKASENSNDDPTYDPYEELDDISSGDELPDSSSSDESDDVTAESKNHDEFSEKSCEQVQENSKGIPDAGESSLTHPCSNSSSKARKRKCSGSNTDNKFEPNSDKSSPAEHLEGKNDDSQLSRAGKGSHKVRRRSSRPMTRLATAKAEAPLHVLLPSCHVELFPIDMTLVVNGSVNLSVVREEELFVTYHSAQGSSELIWARLANAISQTHGVVGDW